MRTLTSIGLTVAFIIALAGCEGPTGPQGIQGPQGEAGPAGPAGESGQTGASTGVLTGTVTNNVTGSAIVGATAELTPAAVAPVTTDDQGVYTFNDLPAGVYTVDVSADAFGSASGSVSVLAGASETVDLALDPTSPVVVSAGANQTAAPGDSVSLTATADLMDGSTSATYTWTQLSGAPVELSGADTATASFTLAGADVYKARIAQYGMQPEGRTMILPVNPYSLEEAEASVFQVAVETSSGTYESTVTVTADLGLAWASGIRNVPVGVPMIFQAKPADAYDWKVAAAPSGSTADLDDATSRNPILVPDVSGQYTVTVGDDTIEFYAGTWSKGAIAGLDASGNPTIGADGCGMCHDGSHEMDAKFAQWAESGHAHIVQQNLDDPHNHWSTSCAECHTVGDDGVEANGGFDQAVADTGWTKPASFGNGTFAKMIQDSPTVAALSNIQCENCHGPNNGGAHHNGDRSFRVSVAADGCIFCHGEPPRHGRGQQWQEAGHGNFATAESIAYDNRPEDTANCGRCHSGQGFVAWAKAGFATDALIPDAIASTLTSETIEPVTCAACHDPHMPGTLSSEPNDATVRQYGNTAELSGGYVATNVGNGALCITCHNGRRGHHGDDTPNPSWQMPHHSVQGDVMMGQNFYFVGTAVRGSHSLIQGTCAACHMELSPPVAEFSLDGAGTNHGFEASLSICGDCHGAFDGASFVQGVEEGILALGAKLNAAALSHMGGKTITVSPDPDPSYDINGDDVTAAELVYSHGQAGLTMTLADETTVTATLATMTVGGAPFYAADGTFTKAAWNYMMLEFDKSNGVHNPSLVLEVLANTMAQDLSN